MYCVPLFIALRNGKDAILMSGFRHLKVEMQLLLKVVFVGVPDTHFSVDDNVDLLSVERITLAVMVQPTLTVAEIDASQNTVI